MDEIKGYSKNLNVNITFEKNKIKVGSRTINHDKIYHVHEDYIIYHSAIFKPAIIVTTAIIFSLLSILLFNTVSLVFAVFGAFLASMYAYFIQPRIIIKNNQDEYIKIIDILYKDGHESLIVKANVNTDSLPNTKKGLMQKRILGRYLSRIRKARNYLIMQYETQPKLTYNALHEKYKSVAQAKYALKSTLEVKSVEELCKAYEKTSGKYVKLGFRIARFSLFMIIVLVLYLTLNKKVSYSSFF